MDEEYKLKYKIMKTTTKKAKELLNTESKTVKMIEDEKFNKKLNSIFKPKKYPYSPKG